MTTTTKKKSADTIEPKAKVTVTPVTKETATKTPAAKTKAAGAATGTKAKETAKDTVKDTVMNGTETVETMMKSGMDAAAKGYEQAFSFSQAQAEKVMDTLYKQCESAAELSKENAELAAKSGNSISEGYQQLNTMFMGMAQDVMKKNFAVAEAFLGAKDFNEVTDIQSNFARESFDAMVKNGNELTNLTTKLTNEAVEPVRKQVTEAVEKMTKAAA